MTQPQGLIATGPRVNPVGPQLKPQWCVVGECPGTSEQTRGTPFVGQSGKVLDNMLQMIIFTTLFIALAIPAVYLSAASYSDSLTADVTVTDQAPAIKVAGSQTIGGSAGTTATVYVYFDASDENGYTDLDNSTAEVTINRSGESSRVSGSCAPTVQGANTLRYNCSILLYYYDAEGSWGISATVDDQTAQTALNQSILASVGTLDYVDVLSTSISFSGAPDSTNNAASPNPQCPAPSSRWHRIPRRLS
jgi:hypothetical protein